MNVVHSPHVKTLVILAVLFPLITSRLWRLDQKSFWFDEAASWRTSSLKLNNMVSSLAQNVHTPFYYLVLKFWINIWSDSPTAIRSCSALFGIAVVLGSGALLCVSTTSQTYQRATIAMLLSGVSPLAVRYSREAVMYSLVSALVLASAWLYIMGRTRGQTRYLWVASGVLSAGLFTHHYVLLHALAQGVIVLWHGGRRCRQEHILIAMLPFVLFAPWAPTLLNQLRLVAADYWIPPLTFESAGHLLWQLWAANDIDSDTWQAVIGWGSAFAAPFACWRWGGALGKLASVHFAFVVVTAFLISIAWRSVVMPRYFAPAHTMLLCGLAAAIPFTPFGRAIALAIVAILVAMLIQLWPQLVPEPTQGLRSAVNWVSQMRSADDVVLVSRPFLFLPWRYYDRKGSVYMTAEAASRLTHYEGLPLLSLSECTPGERIASASTTVWLVHGADRASPPEFLRDAGWARIDRREFTEAFPWQSPVTVERFQSAAAPPSERLKIRIRDALGAGAGAERPPHWRANIATDKSH